MKKIFFNKNDLPKEAHDARIKTEGIRKDMYSACESLKKTSLALKIAAENINKMIVATR